MTITSTYPMSTESAESRRLTLSAPVGYKQNLFQGGLWLLRPEGTLTLGTGNSALLAIAKKSGQTVAVTAQVGNNLAITHTYNGTALVLKPATDGGGVATSTPKDFETYLKGQSAVMEAFSDFVPQGTGLGVMATAAAAAVPVVNSWVAGKTSLPLGNTVVAAGRGTDSVDNSTGLPGAKTATAHLGIFKWQNSTSTDLITSVWTDCYCADDERVAATDNSGARGRVGKVISIEPDGVFVDSTR